MRAERILGPRLHLVGTGGGQLPSCGQWIGPGRPFDIKMNIGGFVASPTARGESGDEDLIGVTMREDVGIRGCLSRFEEGWLKGKLVFSRRGRY